MEITFPELEELIACVDKINENVKIKMIMRNELKKLKDRINKNILFLLSKKFNTEKIKNVKFDNVNYNKIVYNEKLY